MPAIGMGAAERWIGETRTHESRSDLLSAPLQAPAFGHAVRSHWGIENQVPWVLDGVFPEDQSRIRPGHAAANFAVVRPLALNLRRQHPNKRASIKGKRLRAAWDNDFLRQVLGGM